MRATLIIFVSTQLQQGVALRAAGTGLGLRLGLELGFDPTAISS